MDGVAMEVQLVVVVKRDGGRVVGQNDRRVGLISRDGLKAIRMRRDRRRRGETFGARYDGAGREAGPNVAEKCTGGFVLLVIVLIKVVVQVVKHMRDERLIAKLLILTRGIGRRNGHGGRGEDLVISAVGNGACRDGSGSG